MFRSLSISRLTATQRDLPEHGLTDQVNDDRQTLTPSENAREIRLRRRPLTGDKRLFNRDADEPCARIVCSRTPLAAGVR